MGSRAGGLHVGEPCHEFVTGSKCLEVAGGREGIVVTRRKGEPP